ncbi:hypothetical protein BYT27DRAFT_7262510 [Phlegmacium glaucopus]|nr:hypothetical protein BYT27DRAFT_7262510 [Phlegmacium glaucopus]
MNNDFKNKLKQMLMKNSVFLVMKLKPLWLPHFVKCSTPSLSVMKNENFQPNNNTTLQKMFSTMQNVQMQTLQKRTVLHTTTPNLPSLLPLHLHHKVFVTPGHPCNFPAPDNYKALTMDDVCCAQRTRNTNKSSSSSLCPIAAITELNSSVDPLSTDISDPNTNFFASMFRNLNGTSVIGNSSFSDGDISVHPHFKSKHYVWKCMIDGPAVDLPLKTFSLIDNGSHMVLIHPELVAKLNLPIFTLPNPKLIDIAISTSHKKQISLSTFVKLSATSLYGQWTSHTVYAIIAPVRGHVDLRIKLNTKVLIKDKHLMLEYTSFILTLRRRAYNCCGGNR